MITVPIGFFLPGAAPGGSLVASSLVALWDFEAVARGADAVGANTLSAVGAPTYAAGKFGDAAGGFSTANYLVSAAHVGPSGTDAITIFGWFKTTSTSTSSTYFFSNGVNDGTAGKMYLLSVENGVFWLRTISGRVASYGAGLNDGLWHSFAVSVPAVANLSNVATYLDGALVAGVVSGNGPLNLGSTKPTIIGTGYTSSSASLGFFPGSVDQIGVANTAWDATQAAWMHNSGAGRTTAEIITP